MITRVASAILAVGDQDVMVAFFADKLGFATTTDAEMWPGARWLEVTDPVTELWGSYLRVTDPEGRQLLVRSSRLPTQ